MAPVERFKWRSTDARNITTEEDWVAIPKEDYWRLKEIVMTFEGLTRDEDDSLICPECRRYI